MGRKSLVSINYIDYILGFSRYHCAFDSGIRFMGEEPGEGKLTLTQMSGGNVRRLEIDDLDAYLSVYDDAEYNECLFFEDVSFKWQNYLINNCSKIKKQPFIRDLIEETIKDLNKTSQNILKIGKNFTYEVLKDYYREYDKFYPNILCDEFQTVRDRLFELVGLYLNECKEKVASQKDIQRLINFVDTVYYRAESIVGEARDIYLDQKVERDVVDGRAYYKFMDEVIEIDKKNGIFDSYNQKEIYDYCEDMLVALEEQRRKFIYELDRLEDQIAGAENEK